MIESSFLWHSCFRVTTGVSLCSTPVLIVINGFCIGSGGSIITILFCSNPVLNVVCNEFYFTTISGSGTSILTSSNKGFLISG
mgnify:FL=1